MTKTLIWNIPDDGEHKDRVLEFGVIKTITESSQGDWLGVTLTSGVGGGVSTEFRGRIAEGEMFGFETKGGRLCGWWIDLDRPLRRKTEADLDREKQEWLDKEVERKREQLAAYREQWQAEEDALPDWIKARLQYFREQGGGERFELRGWGYELAIAQLAVAYAETDDLAETEKVKELDQKYGCSGNQHDCARWLAKQHREGESLAGTPSGTVMIAGDPFYAGREEPAKA